VVTSTLLQDMPGCIIDMLEPVSKIRLLDILSISYDIVDVPCSNRMGTVSFVTVFSGALRRKELFPLHPSRVSLTRGFLFAFPSSSVWTYRRNSVKVSNVHSGPFSQVN